MIAARMAFLALWAVALCSGSDIVVRLLDGKTGTPMADKPVVIWLDLNSKSRMLDGRTGTDGVALFHIPDDQPIHTITATQATYYQLIDCVRSKNWTDNEFPYQEVISKGVLAVNTCDPKKRIKVAITVKPGEIVIFARKPNWWEAFWMRGQW